MRDGVQTGRGPQPPLRGWLRGPRCATARWSVLALLSAASVGYAVAPPVARAAGPAPRAAAPSAAVPAVPVYGSPRHGASASAPGTATLGFTLARSPAGAAAARALAVHPGPLPDRAERLAAADPPAARRAAVLAWAAARHLTVRYASARVVLVSGPGPVLAAAAGTTLTARRVGGALAHRAGSAPHVPAGLAAAVSGVFGLDDAPLSHTRVSVTGDLAQSLEAVPHQHRGAGYGVTVGTVNLSGWTASDLTGYAQHYGYTLYPGQVSAVPVAGAPVAGDGNTGGGVEVALDTEAILGVAPGAAQRQYFGHNTAADYVAVLDRMVSDAQAGHLQVASTSWGQCEPSEQASDLQATDAALASLAAAGVTLFAASGDTGAYDCTDANGNVAVQQAVDFPASDPHVVGVGGTTLVSSSGGYTNQGWGPAAPTPPAPGTAAAAYPGSGGGPSAVWRTPSWQSGVNAGPYRTVPDIAGDADPNTGYVVYATDTTASPARSGLLQVGGTSLAAPLSAGGLADALAAGSSKAGVGDIHAVLYGNASAFADAVGNSNGAFVALPGYDEVTGLGVPRWSALLGALGVRTGSVPAPALGLPPYATALTVAVSATGSGIVRWSVSAGSGTRCGTGGRTPPTSVALPAGADGPRTVTLAALDSYGACHQVSRTVVVDRAAPSQSSLVAAYTGATVPSYRVTWAASDPTPGSGLASYAGTVTDRATGAVLFRSAALTARLFTFTGSAGHTYTVAVSARDHAGHTSAVLTRQVRAADDDRAFVLTGGWLRIPSSNAFLGSLLGSGRPGATATVHTTGRGVVAGFLRQQNCGYLDVLVDGRLTQRINLYAPGPRYRQVVVLAAWATVQTHTVTLRVDGTHQAGATGSVVYPDLVEL